MYPGILKSYAWIIHIHMYMYTHILLWHLQETDGKSFTHNYYDIYVTFILNIYCPKKLQLIALECNKHYYLEKKFLHFIHDEPRTSNLRLEVLHTATAPRIPAVQDSLKCKRIVCMLSYCIRRQWTVFSMMFRKLPNEFHKTRAHKHSYEGGQTH